MIHFGLELVYSTAPQGRAQLNIVCVHGLGSKPELTWHHDETGKTWIHDEEFLNHLGRPVRVFSFSYNGDIGANLSAASVAFHASDLLQCLEQAIEDRARAGPVGPVFYVAHGFGGTIVKKAILMSGATPHFPHVRQYQAGVIFFGTPHLKTQSDALQKAVQNTVALFKAQYEQDGEVRQFGAAVSFVNKMFSGCQPDNFTTRSFWETEATTLYLEDGEIQQTVIITHEAHGETASSNDTLMKCNHVNLPQFPDIYDQRFSTFVATLNEMVAAAFSEVDAPWMKPFPRSVPIIDILPPIARSPQKKAKKNKPVISLPPPPPPPYPLPTPPLLPLPAPLSPPVPKSPVLLSPPPFTLDPPPDPPKGFADEDFKFWSRKTDAQAHNSRRITFLRSLKGWSEANTGSQLAPAPRTCQWFGRDPMFRRWIEDGIPMTLFFLGDAGRGKSHLVKAVLEEVMLRKPDAMTMSFHCVPGKNKPKIWEYFTWQLLERRPEYWLDVPPQYRHRDETSSPLGLGSFIEIWQSIRRSGHAEDINLLIDGIEQCGEEYADEFFLELEQLRLPIAPPPAGESSAAHGAPTCIRFFLACRQTPAIDRAATHFSCLHKVIQDADVAADIGRWVDHRLNRLLNIHRVIDPKHLEDTKKRITVCAESYWPFAVHAVAAVERAVPVSAPLPISNDVFMPISLREEFDRKLLPQLQSVSNMRHLRTLLTLMASQKGEVPFSPPQLQDALQCLYGDELHINMVRDIRAHCNDFITVVDGGPLLFTHDSVAFYLNRLLTGHQRSTNLAFMCLKYLMQNRFQLDESTPSRVNLSPVVMGSLHPFYRWATTNWVKKAVDGGPEVLPLVKEFLEGDRRTYGSWRYWSLREDEIPRNPSNALALFPLIRAGATNILRRLLPPPSTASTSDESDFSDTDSIASISTAGSEDLWEEEQSAEYLDIPDWPNSPIGAGLTPLHIAVRYNRLDMAKFILQYQPDLNARSNTGLTPLATCCTDGFEGIQRQRASMARLLLRNGADPDRWESPKGATSLYYACCGNMIDVVRVLLKYGAFVNVATVDGGTPLEKAFAARNVALVGLLLVHGAEVNAWWSVDELPLSQSIIEGQMDMFKLFLPYADLSTRNSRGSLPLHIASRKHRYSAFLRELLKRPNIDLDAIDALDISSIHCRRYNALGYAIEANNYPAVEALLQAGANPSFLPRLREPPLYHAVQRGNIAMVELLLEHKAPVNDGIHNFQGTALGTAVHLQRMDMVLLLLRYGADPTIEDGFDSAGPLFHAIQYETPNVEMVKALLEADIPADVNFVVKGEGPYINVAASDGRADFVKLLLEHGAELDRSLEPCQDISPLHHAINSGSLDTCKVLVEYEPRLVHSQHTTGPQYQAPLIMACARGLEEVVSLLLEKGADPRQLSHHYEESALLRACGKGHSGIVEKVLCLAPDMVNVPCFLGRTPLAYACMKRDLPTIKFLLEAGADMHRRDSTGATPINHLIACRKPEPLFKILELMIAHGLDINTANTKRGFTVLGSAIVYGEVWEVKWLLEHGADALRGQQGPNGTCRTALQVSCFFGIPEITTLLLEPRWGLRETLRHRDWLGATIFFPIVPSKDGLVQVHQIYGICEELRASTGEDIFSDLISQPIVSGYSPIDYALHAHGSKPSATLALNTLIRTTLLQIFRRPRSDQTSLSLLNQLCALLLMSSHIPTQILSPLLSLETSIPAVIEQDDGPQRGIEAAKTCDGCNERITELALVCRSCHSVRGECCEFRERDAGAGEEIICRHAWIETPIRERDWNSEDIQDTLAHLLHLISPSQLPPIEEEIPIDHMQTSLQLATLHAFDLLTIRRPLFTPFLTLCQAVEEYISPWQALISSRRVLSERRNLEYETYSWSRRVEEVDYVRRGLGRAYVDSEDRMMMDVLENVRGLFDEGDEEDEIENNDGGRLRSEPDMIYVVD